MPRVKHDKLGNWHVEQEEPMFKVGQKVIAVSSHGQRVPGEVKYLYEDGRCSVLVRGRQCRWLFEAEGSRFDWHLEPAEPDLPTLEQVNAFHRAHGLPEVELPKPVPFPERLYLAFIGSNDGTKNRVHDMAAALRTLGPDAVIAYGMQMRENTDA